MRGTRNQRILNIVVGCVVVLVVCLLLLPDSHLLLSRAHKNPNDVKPPGFDAFKGIESPWLNDHLRLSLQVRVAAAGLSLFLHDSRDGSLNPIPSFDAALTASHDPLLLASFRDYFKFASVVSYRFSPDGKWLLWEVVDKPHKIRTFYAIPITLSAPTEAVKSEAVKSEAVKSEAVKSEAVKSEAVKSEAVKSEAVKIESTKAGVSRAENERHAIQRWSVGSDGTIPSREDIFWLSDCRHWIEIVRSDERRNLGSITGAIVRDVSDTGKVVRKKFKILAGDFPRIVTRENHLLSFPSDGILAYDVSFGQQTYYETALNDPLPVAHSHTLPLTNSMICFGIYPSPDGKRLLLDLLVVPAPTTGFLNALYSFLHFQAKAEQGLWIIDSDGRNLHEIGHLPPRPPSAQAGNNSLSGYVEPILSDIEWLPDGKQVQFRYDTSLYRLPIER